MEENPSLSLKINWLESTLEFTCEKIGLSRTPFGRETWPRPSLGLIASRSKNSIVSWSTGVRGYEYFLMKPIGRLVNVCLTCNFNFVMGNQFLMRDGTPGSNPFS